MLLSAVLFVLFLAGCWLYCLIDAALTPAAEFRGLRKNAWIYTIAATFVVGAFAWLIARRSRRTKSWVTTQARPGAVAGADFSSYASWTAADTALARHPAGRSLPSPDSHGTVPTGPDDDEDFLRQLDHRIRGTSADPGELPPGRVARPSAAMPEPRAGDCQQTAAAGEPRDGGARPVGSARPAVRTKRCRQRVPRPPRLPRRPGGTRRRIRD
jgi:hypothetical protein